MRDKGGREQWSNYLASSSNGAGGSGSGSTSALPAAQPTQHRTDAQRTQASSEAYQDHNGSSSVACDSYQSTQSSSYAQPKPEQYSPPAQAASLPATSPQSAPVTRVKALHKFHASEAGELAFEKGDIIKVVDRIYKDWWRGQLRGRTGIFPVNYVVSFVLRSRC